MRSGICVVIVLLQLTFACSTTTENSVFPDTEIWNKAPWVTVIVELRVIESLNKPDSVKHHLTRKIFEDYRISETDYTLFYGEFMRQPAATQRAFVKEVRELLDKMVEEGRKSYSGNKSAGNKSASPIPPQTRYWEQKKGK